MCIDFAVVLLGVAIFMLVVSLVNFDQSSKKGILLTLTSALLALVAAAEFLANNWR